MTSHPSETYSALMDLCIAAHKAETDVGADAKLRRNVGETTQRLRDTIAQGTGLAIVIQDPPTHLDLAACATMAAHVIDKRQPAEGGTGMRVVDAIDSNLREACEDTVRLLQKARERSSGKASRSPYTLPWNFIAQLFSFLNASRGAQRSTVSASPSAHPSPLFDRSVADSRHRVQG